MSELISGKEALIALANGEKVEWRHPERDWFIAPKCNMRTQDFFSGVYQFRLKPRAITLNGIEVPAPFEPKEGDKIFILANFLQQGFMDCKYETFEKHVYQFGAWRTEDEIKQVIAALRKIFVINKQ